MSEPNLSSVFSYGAEPAASSTPAASPAPAAGAAAAETTQGADEGASTDAAATTDDAPSAAADKGGAKAKDTSTAVDTGDDDLDKAQTIEDVKKVLKKRSPTREDRAAIEARLARADQADRELAEARGRLAVLEQQSKKTPEPAVDPKKQADDEFTDLLNRGPAYIQDMIRREFAAQAQQNTRKRLFESRQKMLARDPSAHALLVEFVEMAKADPRLEQNMLAADDPADYAVQYTKEAKRIAQYNSLDELLAAERTKWEAEQKAGGAGGDQQDGADPAGATPQRRTPLTLVGNRGGGPGPTPPEPSQEQVLKKSFSY